MAKESKNELTVQESRELLLNPVYQAQKQFEIQQRMAQMYVTSTVVPTSYRGNIGNCVIAIDMAMRMQVNPLMVMQNLYVVNGNPAWSSKFLISCINTSGRFTPLRYQFAGKRGTMQYGCRAYAYERTDKEHKEPLFGIWITMEMAEKEGWTKKSGSKWLTMPDQMLIYRAAAFWSRSFSPEISMGFLTKEEADDNVAVTEMPIVDVEVVNTETETATEEAVAAEPVKEEKEETPQEVIQRAMQENGNVKSQAQAIHERWEQEHVNAETGEILNEEETDL